MEGQRRRRRERNDSRSCSCCLLMGGGGQLEESVCLQGRESRGGGWSAPCRGVHLKSCVARCTDAVGGKRGGVVGGASHLHDHAVRYRAEALKVRPEALGCGHPVQTTHKDFSLLPTHWPGYFRPDHPPSARRDGPAVSTLWSWDVREGGMRPMRSRVSETARSICGCNPSCPDRGRE